MKEAITLSDLDLEKVHSAARIISGNLKYHTTIAELSLIVSLNERKLKQGFKHIYKKGVFAYLLDLRMEKAKEMLLEDIPVRTIALAIGYRGSNAETNFIRSFKKIFNLSPASWKRHQRDVNWFQKNKYSA